MSKFCFIWQARSSTDFEDHQPQKSPDAASPPEKGLEECALIETNSQIISENQWLEDDHVVPLEFGGACLETPDWAEHLPSCVLSRGRKEKGKAFQCVGIFNVTGW